MDASTALINNEATTFGLLMAILGLVFYFSSREKYAGFFRIIPALLLCYFLPSLLTTFGLVSTDNHLYFVASRYLLPASLILLTLSIDLKAVIGLGPKALIMFFTATVGIIIGGPIAVLITSAFAPDLVGGLGPEAVWRGLATVAGSWIGGGANQAAMYEIFQPTDKLYSIMITIDIIVAEIWMAFILIGAVKSDQIDRWLKADNSSVKKLQNSMEDFTARTAIIPKLSDVMMILGIAFGGVALAHVAGDYVAPWFGEHYPFTSNFSLTSGFFWIVIVATTIGLLLSFTRVRQLEGAGASRLGSVFIYILVGTIGMKMDIREIFHEPGLFAVGLIWMVFHVGTLILMAKWIKAPFFFVAVGSKANIGGAASAPVVAAAFHPSLAPVGVLLAVVGYAVGTYGGWMTAFLMHLASGDPGPLMLEP